MAGLVPAIYVLFRAKLKEAWMPATSARRRASRFCAGMTVLSGVNSSCPRLSRASTSAVLVTKKDVDGRDKPGHDDVKKADR
jgi:hypothetical protein